VNIIYMKEKKQFIIEQFNQLRTIEDRKQFNNYILYQLSLLLDSEDYINDIMDFTKLINGVTSDIAKNYLIENDFINGKCCCINSYYDIEIGNECQYTRGISNYRIIFKDKKLKIKKEEFEKYFETL
jgi:hypothetical protein